MKQLSVTCMNSISVKQSMRLKWVLLFLSCIGLSESFAQQKELSQKKWMLLTLGDSNGTFPYSWPQQLQAALPNATVCNISKSGRTIGFINLGDTALNSLLVIDQNLKTANSFANGRLYDFVILELGTNDAKAIFADRQKEVSENLEKLIIRIRQSGYTSLQKAIIIIISPPPYGKKTEGTEKYAGGDRRVEQMRAAFRLVAEKTGCRFVDGYATPGLDINTMSADGIHLDSLGSRKLIEPVVKQMQ